MQPTNLEFAWEVDEPSLGFAERVVVTATGEAFEALDRTSGMVPRFSPPEHRLSRRAFATAVVVAAAAAAVCLLAAPTGQVSGRTSALEEELSYGYPQGLLELRSTASGGNTANNPEAGATGLW